ncbi:hypothetical protein PCANC_25551 [Puccinia coronata f. sp. avenae]|uniref:Uncharacterized protein n=1 Tax=Puccinia coronata f. sp. avenae TaxID=200324 RepID=A0A2N5S0Z8_9BASI|nr:hypothetical protein PCANC_25551 [Puccinia coronata f. sp. avenae]
MDESPSIPVAETIASFRAVNPDGKSEDEYHVIFTQVIAELVHRVRTRQERVFVTSHNMHIPLRAPASDVSSNSGNEVAKRLGRAILPAFKEKLRHLPLVMNPSNGKNDTRSWYEEILDQLIDIDETLEEIESSLILIWKSWKPNQGDNPSSHQLSLFNIEKISDLTEELLRGPFRGLLNACRAFFNGSSASTQPSTDTRLIYDAWEKLDRRSTLTIEKTEKLIEWIQKPMLSVAKKEWQELVEVIENELGKISECLHQIYHKLLKVCEPDSDDDIEVISGASGIKFSFDDKIKFIRDGYPILKLCRIFFSKLSQITSNQQLIFVEPSMQMEPDRLNKLRKSTSETWMFIYKYSHALVYPPLHPRAPVVAYALINLRGGMINCYSEHFFLLLKQRWSLQVVHFHQPDTHSNSQFNDNARDNGNDSDSDEDGDRIMAKGVWR